MKDKIQEMVEDGFAISKIHYQLNLPLKEVNKIVKENSFSLKKEVFKDEDKEKIINLYKTGVSAKNLGIKYSISKSKIMNWAKEGGFLRDRNFSHRLHFFNENIFDLIDTQDKAYWLGFLYADGYNNEKNNFISLNLKLSDKDHIIKFSNFIGADTFLIKELKVKNKNSFCGIRLNSKHLSQQLKKLGCMQNKSLILKYPDYLSEDLQFHFIRGYFDGNGCLSFKKKQKEYKLSVIGTKEFCEKVIEIFKTQNINLICGSISDEGKNTYCISTNGNLKIRKISDIIYKNASIYLDRKYKLYCQLKEQNKLNHPELFGEESFVKIIEIDGKILNTDGVKKLSEEEKRNLLPKITDYFINKGFIYADYSNLLNNDYNNLVNYSCDLNVKELNNHSRLGTNICKYFCHSYFDARTREDPAVSSIFNNKEIIEKAIKAKFNKNKACSISYQTVVDELKNLRLAANVSIFKPSIAKYMCLKYSEEGDVVGDYSCGFGGRLLGAMASNRKYIGTDPHTHLELQNMIDYFNFKNCKVINSGSEYYRGEENSIDLYYSSPPYYDQEIYSDSLNQAYNKGESHYYNIYWRKTLENVKYMLKPNKYFGVNISNKYPKIIEIAKEYFGDVIEEIKLKSIRYHYEGEDKVKYESIYMFKNIK